MMSRPGNASMGRQIPNRNV